MSFCVYGLGHEGSVRSDLVSFGHVLHYVGDRVAEDPRCHRVDVDRRKLGDDPGPGRRHPNGEELHRGAFAVMHLPVDPQEGRSDCHPE